MESPVLPSKSITSLPEKFDGEKDFYLWLRHYEVCATANNWSEDQRLLFLPTFLKDRAFAIYDELPVAARGNFQDVCAGLGVHFSPPERKRVFMAEYCSRKQRAGERAEDFAQELIRLLARAMPQISEDARKVFVCEQFILGLGDNLQDRVVQANPEDLSAAISVAKRCEAFIEIHSRNKQSLQAVRTYSLATHSLSESAASCTAPRHISTYYR